MPTQPRGRSFDQWRADSCVATCDGNFSCVNLVVSKPIQHTTWCGKKTRAPPTLPPVPRWSNIHIHTHLPFRKSNPKSFLRHQGRGNVWRRSTRTSVCENKVGKGGVEQTWRMKQKHSSKLSSLQIPYFHVLSSLIVACPKNR